MLHLERPLAPFASDSAVLLLQDIQTLQCTLLALGYVLHAYSELTCATCECHDTR